MKKEEFIKLGLTEELAVKAEKASLEEIKNYIPKSRFDEVNNSKKQLETDIATRDTQIEKLKAVDGESLKAEIEKLQAANKTTKEQYDKQLSEIQLNNAVDTALLSAKAKNTKAVKALIDKSKLKLDGSTVIGLKEQLDTLTTAEDTKFLFGTPTKKVDGLKIIDGKDDKGGDGTITKKQFRQMKYSERLNLYNTDKATYDALIGK